MRSSHSLVLAICIGLVSSINLSTNAEESIAVREWASANGQMVRASLVSHSPVDGRVKLKLEETDKEIDMELEKLSMADQHYLSARGFQPEDQQQFEILGPHLEALRDTPDTTIEILKEIGKNYKSAPYANLWAGVALAAGRNKPEEALKELQQAQKRVVKQQEHDSSLHRRTLGAILNNMAVCYIKLYKPDLAADKFLDALEQVERTPPILSHNIRYLREISENPRSSLEMSDSNKKKIVSALARLPLEDAKKKLQPGWYYTLEMDVPYGQGNELSIDGVLPPDISLELISSGSGLVVSPGYVLTVKPIVMNNMRPATFATVAVPSTKDKWVLKPARKVIIATGSKQIIGGSNSTSTTNRRVRGGYEESTTSGSASRSDTTTPGMPTYGNGYLNSPGGQQSGTTSTVSATSEFSNTVAAIDISDDSTTNSSTTNYKVTEPEPGESGAELALLQIEKLGIEPATFADIASVEGEKIVVGGYQRGQTMLKDGVAYQRGDIISAADGATFLTTALVNGGSRGGPILNKDYQILGMVWSQPKEKISGARSVAFSVEEIRRWIGNHSNAELKPDPEGLVASKRKSTFEKAIVPVLSWGRREDFSDPMFQKYYNEDSLIDLLVIRDQWCFACKGTSVKVCKRCNSHGQVKTGTEQVKWGQTPDGRDLYRPQAILSTCRECGGEHKLRCTDCDGTGKLRGGPDGKPGGI